MMLASQAGPMVATMYRRREQEQEKRYPSTTWATIRSMMWNMVEANMDVQESVIQVISTDIVA